MNQLASRIYYFLDTSGPQTNLQLYSLRQAQKYWQKLEDDVSSGSEPEHLHERCVFILATLGLSISQLLGQNDPQPERRVPEPMRLWNKFVDHHGLNAALKERFKDFSEIYNGCRHVGVTKDNLGYEQIVGLTFEVTREWYEFGHEVWQHVINVFRTKIENDLTEFDLDGKEEALWLTPEE